LKSGDYLIQAGQVPVPVQLSTVKSTLGSVPDHPTFSVTMHWFIEERSELPIPLDQAIWRYDADNIYAKLAVKAISGCFTSDESKALIHYLNDHTDYATEAFDLKLPMSMKRAAILYYSRNRKTTEIGHYHLYENSNYDLDFKVSGYYYMKYKNAERI
jgi:uncharacterized membrane protein YvbJ